LPKRTSPAGFPVYDFPFFNIISSLTTVPGSTMTLSSMIAPAIITDLLKIKQFFPMTIGFNLNVLCERWA
jgi:hypothetical protein